MPATRPPAQTTRPTLQSVSIALDIIDALADCARAQPERAGPSRRRGQEHGPSHLRGARRARAARPHRRAAATGWGCGSSSTATSPPSAPRCSDRGLPLLVELRNALGETVQIGVPAGADVVYVERVEGRGRCATRRTRGARRSTARAPARCWPPTTPTCSRPGCKAGLPAEHRLHDRRARAAGGRARPVRAAGLRPQRGRDRAGHVVAGRPGRGPRPAGRWWRRSRWSDRRRASSGEHEAHHVATLQAGAKKLGDAIGKGEYALRRRHRPPSGVSRS